ncbi:MAG: hypothetical protein IRY91_05935 [Gemmatimonadaceae bacterium]|nr:hypothetical protein [Gemmatimonadaceae bacterium]
MLITVGVVAIVAALVVLKAPRSAGAPSRMASVPTATMPLAPDSVAGATPNLAPPRGKDIPPIGDFVYLFDVSGSIKRASAGGAFDDGLKLLMPMFFAIKGLDELTPERHRVATIGAMSLHREPLCDIYVAQRNLFTMTDTMAPVRAMGACLDSLRAAPAEPYTDINGALLYAALSLRGDRPAVRGAILVTDLDEDRAPGTTPATPDLHGLCIDAYMLVTTETAMNPALLQTRQVEWERRLTMWGARKVRIQNALSFDAGDLQRFFRTCEGQ